MYRKHPNSSTRCHYPTKKKAPFQYSLHDAESKAFQRMCGRVCEKRWAESVFSTLVVVLDAEIKRFR
eukprot:1265376-Rhodomonas_salina.1